MLLYSWLQKALKGRGSTRALIYRDTYLSWRGLHHRVERRAQEFETAGVRPGDFVGIMLGNVPDFIILSLALSKLRAVPVPLDPITSTRELEVLMSVIPLRGLVTRPRGGDAPLPSMELSTNNSSSKSSPGSTVEKKRIAPESRKRLQGTLLTCAIYPCEKRTVAKAVADQISVVLITANSSGDPKPVERTNRNLESEAAHLSAALDLTIDDRTLLTVPLFQSFGFDFGIVGSFSKGATLCLEDDVAPSRVIKVVREQKITVLPGTETLFSELGRLPSHRPLGHKPLRFVSSGRGLVGPALETFFQKYGTRPIGCLHTTETGTITIDRKGQHGTTLGKAIGEHIELRITSSDPLLTASSTKPKTPRGNRSAKRKGTSTAKPLPSGQKGTLWVRSPALSPLRLAPPPLNPALLKGGDVHATVGFIDDEGWFRSGDLASIDRAKRITLHSREDDLVRLDGKRVSLGEIEGCIEALAIVSSASAEVIRDATTGPIVVAHVKLNTTSPDDVVPETIIDHCARNLAPHKVPRRVELSDA